MLEGGGAEVVVGGTNGGSEVVTGGGGCICADGVGTGGFVVSLGVSLGVSFVDMVAIALCRRRALYWCQVNDDSGWLSRGSYTSQNVGSNCTASCNALSRISASGYCACV
jgi:hypothetical protein